MFLMLIMIVYFVISYLLQVIGTTEEEKEIEMERGIIINEVKTRGTSSNPETLERFYIILITAGYE